ncbi:MAG: tetratricopeptide repeat protein [Melioribacteraceae bacterium]|nr:tetratricopeptide repeat protein [Melioribacteraceae bacterium]
MRIVIIFILIFINTVSFSSGLKKLVQEGLEASYQFQFEKADSIYNLIITDYPENPEGYLYISQNYLWFFLGTRDDGNLRAFEEYTNLSMDKIYNLIESNGESVYLLNMLAKVYLQKALVAATDESVFDAFWSTKTAYGYYEEILNYDSTYASAYLGIGLLEYALSYVPAMFKWAVDITGLGRDKKQGFEYVCRAADLSNENILKTEAEFHKAKLLTEYIGDHKASALILENLLKRYPKNLIFKYQLAIAYLEDKMLDKAETLLQSVIANTDKNFIQTVSFSDFLLGEISFLKNDFGQSIVYYEQFLDSSRGFEFSGIAYFNIGISHLFQGKRDEGIKKLLLAASGNTEISDDAYAARRSTKIINSPVIDMELKIIKARNYLSASEYNSTVEELNNFVNEEMDDELKIESLLLLSEAKIRLENYMGAKEYLSKINIELIEEEMWLIPLYYLFDSQIEYALGNRSAAIKLLEIAFENNNYDFQEKIYRRLNYHSLKMTGNFR